MTGFLLEILHEIGGILASKVLPRLRKLSTRARLLILLAVVAVVLQVFWPEIPQGAVTGTRRVAMAALDGDALPLRGVDRQRLDRLIYRFGDFLHSGYSKQFDGDTTRVRIFQAWDTAQVAVALNGLNLPGRASIEAPKILAYLQSTRSADCSCWKERQGEDPGRAHVGATAWVLYAKAQLGISAEEAEIRFLLDQQHARANSWSMFPCVEPDSGSTYATAWAVLALGEQTRRKLLPEHLSRQVGAAVRSGLSWLEAQEKPNGLWASYPRLNHPEDISYSNSGFATFVLNQLELYPSAERRRSWMRHVPAALPKTFAAESYNSWVCQDNNSQREAVRYLLVPWILVASAEAYGDGSLLQRARVVRLVEDLVAREDDLISEVGQEYFLAAEVVIALRHIRESLLQSRPSEAAQPNALADLGA